MYGLYQQTISRKGNDTLFTVQPLNYCEYAKDGLIKCIGKIGIYDYKMPIFLAGSFDEDRVFHVTEDHIPSSADDENNLLLNYLAPWLSETKKKKFKDDLFQKTEKDFIACGLNRQQSKKLFCDIKKIKDDKKLVHLLMAYGINKDDIEVALKRGITYQSFLYQPYNLSRVTDIDFYTVDIIALQHFRLNPYSVMRLCSFVRNAMDITIKSGNTCISADALLHLVNTRLKNSIVKDINLNASLLVMCTQELNFVQRIQDGKIYFYDKQIAQEEDIIIEQIIRMKNGAKKLNPPNIEEIEKKLKIKYTDGQRKVFQALQSTGIKILIGPPGSGKTALIQGLTQNYHSVKLSATTGRAAQVLKEATQKETSTVHKMLEIRPYGENLSSKNINNPIQADLIIVDEVSMMGLKLASFLLQAVKNSCILLLVGDVDQLQSVEYGNVLSDFINSGCIEIYRLTEVMRQKGTILQNAKQINQGNPALISDNDFHIFECENTEMIFSYLRQNIHPDDQILTTIKKRELGTKSLNESFQDKSSLYCTSYGGVDFYKNNRIIMTETNYDSGYFNGDMGTIVKMEGQGLLVNFKDKTIYLNRKDMACMELANAVTIHKSQGSEFSRVHIILPDECVSMLTRRMIYTAVTRAKNEVFIYSIKHSLQLAIRNVEEKQRTSLLGKRLKKIVQN